MCYFHLEANVKNRKLSTVKLPHNRILFITKQSLFAVSMQHIARKILYDRNFHITKGFDLPEGLCYVEV